MGGAEGFYYVRDELPAPLVMALFEMKLAEENIAQSQAMRLSQNITEEGLVQAQTAIQENFEKLCYPLSEEEHDEMIGQTLQEQIAALTAQLGRGERNILTEPSKVPAPKILNEPVPIPPELLKDKMN